MLAQGFPQRPRVVFMGSADFAVPSLQAVVDAGCEVVLVVTRPDKPRGRNLEMARTPLRELADRLSLPCITPKGLRDLDTQNAIRAAAPDVIVVVAYGRILPPEVLTIPVHGCINVHGSLLPKYRGAAPIQWAVIHGEDETGVTIMRMDEGCDTGPILLQRSTPIEPLDTAGTLFARLAPMGASLLASALPKVLDGSLQAVEQDSARATQAPIIAKELGRIDWTWEALRIANLVRGVEPWPGAYTFTDAGLRLRIFPFVAPIDGNGCPGEILSIDQDGMRVATGRGAVRVREVQPAGGRSMDARELAAGRRIAVGMVLGGTP